MTAMKRRTFLQAAGYTALYGSLVADFAKSAAALTPLEIAGSDPDLHLLRRISFGPVAQELARVKSLGRTAYLDEQLALRDSGTETMVTSLYPMVTGDALTLFTTSLGGFDIQPHIDQYQAAMIYRALFSKAQLFEVMTDFWNDHFNTYIKKNPIPLKLAFDRDVIRKNALGNFKTLLRASVRHLEMLHYLDNWMNTKSAINENYARELLELHTLGKDGGYSEADMKALSRILTGLSYAPDPAAGLTTGGYGKYTFTLANHDITAKTFLGQYFPPGGGEAEIDRALNLILDHAGTARFIAKKLCQRFIADQPPASAVDAVAATFTSSGGDIPAMLRTLFARPEFAASAGQKFKRPQQSMVSAVRACGVNSYDQLLNNELYGYALYGGGLLIERLNAAGQAPFSWVPPNGYPDTAAYWSNTNSLLYQQKFLVKLAETISYSRLLADPVASLTQGSSTAANVAKAKTPREAVNHCIGNLLFTALPQECTAAAVDFVAQADDPDAEVPANQLEVRIKGLVFVLLSSPWFLVR